MHIKRILQTAFFILVAHSLLSQVPEVSSGTIKHISKFPSKYVTARDVNIWIPEAYDKSQKYAVLYMHDGQMLFDPAKTWNDQEWKVDETLSTLIAEGKVRKCIVVGIANDSEMRWSDYNPQKAMDYMSDSIAKIMTSDKLMGKSNADNYLKFLVTELKPYIDKKFSTHTNMENTFVMGASMGGLISMYAICEYPDVFGGAGCMSTHWVGDPNNFSEEVPESYNKYLQDHLPDPDNHKIYFDYGTETLDSLYKPYQQKVDETMEAKGYDRSNWMTEEFSGDAHVEEAWANRLDNPLVFLLGDD